MKKAGGLTLIAGRVEVKRARRCRGFTMIEIMIAMTLFMLILGATYSSWTAILRGSRVGLDAAAEVQRKRVSMRVVEDALKSTLLYQSNLQLYQFVADTSNADFASLSFVAKLPDSFPRSGRYPSIPVRRVTFTVEPSSEGRNQLVMRQSPLLAEEVTPMEEEFPLVLAKNLKLFVLEFWNQGAKEWQAEWLNAAQVPPLVRVTIATLSSSQNNLQAEDLVQKVVKLPEFAVPSELQTGDNKDPVIQRGNRVGQGNQDGSVNVDGSAPGMNQPGQRDPRRQQQPIRGNRR